MEEPSTPGLDRLEALRAEGRYLFQGDRAAFPAERIYPCAITSKPDPMKLRGWWLPGVGPLIPFPVITDVFASPLAAALVAITRAPEGAGVFHVDEFDDGTVALTLGENSGNAGMLEQAIKVASRLNPDETVPGYFVNVVTREAFPEENQGLPLVGLYTAPNAVRVERSIELTAGDVRALARILGRRLMRFDTVDVAGADPFTGPYSAGGHIQFEPHSGKRSNCHRVPTDRDRVLGLQLATARSDRWLQQRRTMELEIQKTALEDRPRHPSSAPSARPDVALSPFKRALSFIQSHCTGPITVEEIAQVAELSPGRLHAVFKSALGCTPLQYVADRRLDAAERMLAETGLSVAEISERCGFAEQTSLTRSFRLRRGLTPSQIRRASAKPDRLSR